jgi:hypothetical protein
MIMMKEFKEGDGTCKKNKYSVLFRVVMNFALIINNYTPLSLNTK